LPAKMDVAALSDVGCVRANNEDSFGYDSAHGLHVVCDGMGGMAAGEVASSLACSTSIQMYATQPTHLPMEVRLSEAIQTAHLAVCEAARRRPELKGMGTTLVAAAVQSGKLLVGNVGDSRAFMLKDGGCMQLTVDHSYSNELVRSGAVSLEEVGSPRFRNFESVITRALGTPNELQPDFFFMDLSDGDAVLLASDGLTRYLDAKTIARLVQFGGPDALEASCQRLVAAAKAAGGVDNITCMLLQYHDLPA